MNPDNLIAVGKFTAPHGLKGFMKLMSYTEYPEDIFNFSALYNKDGHITYRPTFKSTVKNQFLVTLEGVTSKEAADTLRNITLYADKNELPTLEDDSEFYITDLIGMRSLTHISHELVGTVKAVHNFGAGDMLEIQPEKGASFMLLFTRDNVPDIDQNERIIYCSFPEILKAKED